MDRPFLVIELVKRGEMIPAANQRNPVDKKGYMTPKWTSHIRLASVSNSVPFDLPPTLEAYFFFSFFFFFIETSIVVSFTLYYVTTI